VFSNVKGTLGCETITGSSCLFEKASSTTLSKTGWRTRNPNSLIDHTRRIDQILRGLPGVHWVVKADTDTYYNVPALVKMVNTLHITQKQSVGPVVVGSVFHCCGNGNKKPPCSRNLTRGCYKLDHVSTPLILPPPGTNQPSTARFAYTSGGSGFLLNRAAWTVLTRTVELKDLEFCRKTHLNEDIATVDCIRDGCGVGETCTVKLVNSPFMFQFPQSLKEIDPALYSRVVSVHRATGSASQIP